VIRFTGEYAVDVPLWDDDGLMYATPSEFAEGLGPIGLSGELVAEVVTWSREWESRSGEPEHDAQAARLIRRLRAELGHGVQIVYQP
jgi:hypothetical protein